MNWDSIKGNWKQFTGSAKKMWGRLTDDELLQISGDKEKLVGKLQEKYGYAKEEAHRQVSEWEKSQQEVTAQGSRGGTMKGGSNPAR
ncbi:MAG: CsbD family protein [Candidatus Polarisedimenticolia bacterium]